MVNCEDEDFDDDSDIDDFDDREFEHVAVFLSMRRIGCFAQFLTSCAEV